MSTKKRLLLLLTLTPLTLGCEVPELDTPTATQTSGTQQAAAEEKPDESVDMSGVPNEPPPVTAEPREFKAKDGKKGKASRATGGYLGAVVSTRFTAVNQITKLSYKKALNYFWATNDRYPESHEEFMKEIIEFNRLELPELEEGVEYIYDPEDHELKIYRPEE